MITHKNDELEALIKWVESQPRFKPKSDLKRMKKALEMMHISLPKTYMIHVAGTNGKGSVCQFLTQIFLAKKLKVGTFTSPYILQFNERMTINDEPLPDEEMITLLTRVKSFNDRFATETNEYLSFFELLTLAALMTFQAHQVDVAIMEVGIGGLLDATNAYDHYDLSLITNIGFDHMAQLGNTLESIAYNKLGILRPNGQLITTVDEVLHDYFIHYAKPLNAKLTLLQPSYEIISENPLMFVYERQTYRSGLKGNYQIKNAILAIEAVKATPFNITYEQINEGLKKSFIPARFQMIAPRVIVDGAHNVHAIQVLKQTLQNAFPHDKFHIVFSALGDKDIKGLLEGLLSFSDQIDLVDFPDFRFVPLNEFQSSKIIYHKKDAIKHLKSIIDKQHDDEVIVVTGSLHFAGYVLKNYK